MSSEEKREKIADYSLHQAERYRSECCWGRSFPHYLVFGQLKHQQFVDSHVDNFLTVVHAFAKQLENDGKPNKVRQVYEQATELLPEHTKLLTNYASVLFKQGRKKDSEQILRKVLTLDKDNLLALDRLENLASSLLDRWHFPMLNDSIRNSKYKRAIENKVKAGCETVLDIGTGTGLLSLYASQAGASAVYACEVSEVMAITAKDVFSSNPEGGRIRLIPKLSVDLDKTDVPEPVQLLVTETFDAGLLGEHALVSLSHAWNNQLHFPTPQNPLALPCSVIPEAARFYIAPISCKYISRQHYFTNDKYGYLEMQKIKIRSNVNSSSTKEPYNCESLRTLPGGFQYLSEPKELFSMQFDDKREVEEMLKAGRTKSIEFDTVRDGECDAIAAWFTLKLDENESLSTSPDQTSCWHQAVFPVISDHRKVYKNLSKIITVFKIQQGVELLAFEAKIQEGPTQNGNGNVSRWDNQIISLPPADISLINCSKLEEINQWVAYYSRRDVKSDNILDLTGEIPMLSLEIAKISPHSKFTLKVDTADKERVGCLLDFITAVASNNQFPVTNFSCITELPESCNEKFDLCLVTPVQSCGRLDQNLYLGLQQTLTHLTPNSGLVLPHKLQLWAQLVQSEQLSKSTHLQSNEPVSGFRVADQVNILAVTHQQDLMYKTLDKTELSAPVHVRDIDLTRPDTSRQFVNIAVNATEAGKVQAVAYWFVQDYGWNLQLSTLESEAFAQCAVMCKEKLVEKDQSVQIVVQMEEGLLHFSVR